MLTATLLLTLLSLSPITSPTPATDDPFAEVARAVRPAIITVIGYDRDGVELRRRPGFLVGERHALCVRGPLVGAARAEAARADGVSLAVEGVAGEDLSADLLLLQLEEHDPVELGAGEREVGPIRWRTRPPAVGDLVLVVPDAARPGGGVTAGRVQAIGAPAGGRALLSIDADVGPLRVGSPVVSYDGELLGVAAFRYEAEGKVNRAVVTQRLAALKPGEVQPLKAWSKAARRAIPRQGTDSYALARAAHQAGDLARALTLLEEAVMKAPGHHDAWLVLGFVLAQTGRWEEAIESFERVTRLFRDHAEAQVNLCVAQTQLERWEAALPRCGEAIRLQPRDARALFHQGLALHQLERWGEALAAYTSALEYDRQHADAAFNRGLIGRRHGRHDKAAADFARATRARPGMVTAHARLGDSLQALERHEDAVAAYQAALKLAPEDARVLERLGRSFVALNRLGKALDAFERAARLVPSEARTFMAMGRALAGLKRWEKAIAMYRHALRLNPQFTSAQVALGDLYYRLDRLDEAAKAYQQAIDVDERAVAARFGLGQLHVRRGEKDAAWEQVRALKPLSPERASELSRMIVK